MKLLSLALALVLLAGCAAPRPQRQEMPLHHPNGPTYCSAAGAVLRWRWRADESGDRVYNVLLVRDGKPTIAMSAFSFQPPPKFRDTFIFAILPKGEPGREVLVTAGGRLVDLTDDTEYSLENCAQRSGGVLPQAQLA